MIDANWQQWSTILTCTKQGQGDGRGGGGGGVSILFLRQSSPRDVQTSHSPKVISKAIMHSSCR